MAAAQGNQYAAKERVWAAAIDKALTERGKEKGRMGALVELAHKLLDRCEVGDISSLKELGDRLDGKPAQSVAVTGEGGGPVRIIAESLDEKL